MATIECIVQTFEYDGGDIRASQQWGDLSLDSIPAAYDGLVVTPFSRGSAVESGQTIPPSASRTLTPVSLGGGTLQQFLGIQAVWMDDFDSQSAITELFSWQPSYIPKPETTANRYTDWDDAGDPSAKYVQGFILEFDTYNAPKSIVIRNGDTLNAEQTFSVTANGQQEQAFSFDSPFIAHLVRIEPQGTVPWRFFRVRWVYQATPETVITWQTQGTAFGQNGYSHIRSISAAYSATAPVTLTITTYDGQSPDPVILPSTAGQYQKTQFLLTFNKGLLFFFKGVSAAPWTPYLDDFEIDVGNWGRTGPYLTYKNIGGERGDQARI